MNTNETNETQTEKTSRKNITAEVFLEAAWQAKVKGQGHADIAKQLGIKTSSVASRLYQLRTTKKIAVPSFPRGGGGGRKLNVDALNAIAAKYQEEVSS